jgi:hypothetical protein
MRYQRGVNCSAALASARRKAAMPSRARAAQRALAWVEAILSVVWRAWRMRSAMPAGDRLQVLYGLGQPGEQVPPVVDKRHDAGGEPAAGEVVGGETAPCRRHVSDMTPLVLQLVEGILAIGAIAIELAESEKCSPQAR